MGDDVSKNSSKLEDKFGTNTDNLNLLCKRDISEMNLTSNVEVKFIRTMGMKSNMIIQKK